MPWGFSALGQFHGGGVADRRVDRDDSAGLCVGRQFADDLTHLRIVENGYADETGGGNVGHTFGQLRAGFGQRRHRFSPHIEDRESARPADQPFGHRRPHVAQSDVAEA